MNTVQTKQNFMTAFEQLYKNLPVQKITVGALCKNAGYSRATFYEYFKDMYDILEQLEEDTISEYLKILEEYIIFEKKIDELELLLIQGFPKAYTACADRINLFLSENGDPAFPEKMYHRLHRRFSDILERRPVNYRYLMEYVFRAHLAVLSAWSKDGQPFSLEILMRPFLAAVNEGIVLMN